MKVNSPISRSEECLPNLEGKNRHDFRFPALHSQHKLLRMCCWVVVLSLGAGSAWAARFTMYPDGISYLDVGDAFWRGDWHNAINAYWSPLYPCIAGLFIKVLRPAPGFEYPLVHLVNFLIYAAALISFDFFFRTFLKYHLASTWGQGSNTQIGLPTWGWLIVGYCAFTISSLFLVTISFVSGDMAAAAVIYLAAALILKIHRGPTSWRTFALLGLALGIGYLAKTVMFLMAFPFLAVAVASEESRGQKIRSAAVALAFFLLVSAPL